MNLSVIEHLTKNYADARDVVTAHVTALNEKIDALKKSALPKIKQAVENAAAHHNSLQSAIEEYPHLFDSPRTQVFHGIKVGLRKGAGGINWDDDAKVCALIKKCFGPSRSELLIKTTEKPIAKALEDLDVIDLKRIGCRIEETGDKVVIKPTDTEIEKLVDALLESTTETETQEAA